MAGDDDGVDEKEANGEDDRIDADDGGALSPTTLGDMRPAGDEYDEVDEADEDVDELRREGDDMRAEAKAEAEDGAGVWF